LGSRAGLYGSSQGGIKYATAFSSVIADIFTLAKIVFIIIAEGQHVKLYYF
jgi:hypothetical protein